MATLPVPTLDEFLLARYEEIEKNARECARIYPPSWDLIDRGYTAYITADKPNFMTVTTLNQEQAPAHDGWLGDYLRHIADNDPNYVLADITSKRAIVALHADGNADLRDDDEDEEDDLPYYCTTCEDRKRHDAAHWPCPTLLALAQPFADHHDFRKEWLTA